MPVKRRVAIERHSSELLPIEMAYLRDEPMPAEPSLDVLHQWWSMDGWAGGVEGCDAPRYCYGIRQPPRPSMAQVWAAVGLGIVAEWIETRPGTRPSVWWICSAPELRRRLGGTGQAAGRYVHRGMPYGWAWPPSAYEANFTGGPPPCDPNDPPVFESEATFLRRHGLLFPGELERLTAADFEPEAIRVPDHVFAPVPHA